MSVKESVKLLSMSDGFRLFARHWELVKDAKRTVVCIHGLGGCCGCFKRVGFGLASRGVDVWGFDLRGFGDSKEDSLPRGHTRDFDRHLKDIDEAVRSIRSLSNCDKMFLLGHSLGGLYVLWYGAKYPDVVDGLVLLAPSVTIKPIMTTHEQARFMLAVASSPEAMIDTGRVSLSSTSPEIVQYLPVTRSFSVRYLMGLRSFLMADNIFVNASKQKKPTLIVQGDADDDALPVGANQLFKSITAQDKKLETISGAKHTLYGAIFSVRTGYSEDSLKERESILSLVYDWLIEH